MAKLSSLAIKFFLGAIAFTLLAVVPYYLSRFTLVTCLHWFPEPQRSDTFYVWFYGILEAMAIVTILYGSLLIGERIYAIIGNALNKIIHPLTKDS